MGTSKSSIPAAWAGFENHDRKWKSIKMQLTRISQCLPATSVNFKSLFLHWFITQIATRKYKHQVRDFGPISKSEKAVVAWQVGRVWCASRWAHSFGNTLALRLALSGSFTPLRRQCAGVTPLFYPKSQFLPQNISMEGIAHGECLRNAFQEKRQTCQYFCLPRGKKQISLCYKNSARVFKPPTTTGP